MTRFSRIRNLVLTAAVIGLAAGASAAVHKHNRNVNLLTTDYDLVDTSYIDRGRMDGIKVGEEFTVNNRDGKTVTKVIVTAVYDRMSAVKIKDSWLLKDGLLAKPQQRPYTQPLESAERRPAPEIAVKSQGEGAQVAQAPGAPAEAPAAPAPSAPDAAMAPPLDAPALPGDDMGMPGDDMMGAPALPGDDMGMPGDDMMGAPALPGDDMGMPGNDMMDAPALPGDDMGMPGDPMGMPGDDMGLPPAPGAGGDDFGLPPAPGGGDDFGLPPAPGGDDLGVPPPPDF